MQRLRILVAVVWLALPALVRAQSVGVYSDAEATDTRICVPVGVPVTIYLTFRQVDSPGITGFEGRVVGLPPGWLVMQDCGPIGCPPGSDVFGSGGNVAWPTCRTGDRVTILVVTVIAIDVQEGAEFVVVARDPPTDPAFDCPLVTRCDAPTFTRECVTGLRTRIEQNGCPVGVQQQTVSIVKQLYR